MTSSCSLFLQLSQWCNGPLYIRYTGWFRRKGQHFGRSLWDKKFTWTCVEFWMFTEITAVWQFRYRIIVSGNEERETTHCSFYFKSKVMFKWHICYTKITYLLQFTVNVWKISPLISVHFAARVQRSRVVHLSWSWTFPYVGSSIQIESKQLILCIHLYFVNFAFLSNPTNRNLMALGLESQTAPSL